MASNTPPDDSGVIRDDADALFASRTVSRDLASIRSVDQLFDIATASLNNLDVRGISTDATIDDIDRALKIASGSTMSADDGPLRVGDALVALRRTPFLTTRLDGASPAWTTGLAAERRIGPIVDRLGRPIWIDVFRQVRQLRFVHTPGAPPFLAMPIVQSGLAMRRATLRAGDSLNIARGSLWFATGLFSAAPPNVYSGVRIASGHLRFSADVTLGDEEVVVPPAVSVDLDIQFDPPAAAASPAGSVFATTRITAPDGLHMSIRPGDRSIQVRGRGVLKAWGAEIALTPEMGPAEYRADLNRLVLSMTPEPRQFSVTDVVSTLFVPEGDAQITAGGLALPAAVIAPADLGDASGIGALMIAFGSGLSARWLYEARPSELGAGILLLDESRLALTAHTVPATGVVIRPALANIARPAELAIARKDQATLYYVAMADGSESVIYSANVDVRAPKPVDVSGNHVSCRLVSAQIVIGSTAAGERSLGVAGFSAPPDNRPQQACALTNAVLRATPPRAALLQGRLTGETITEGQLLIGYGLSGLLPSLPDPYAANLQLGPRFGAGDHGLLVSHFRFGPGTDTLGFVLPTGVSVDATGTTGTAGLLLHQPASPAVSEHRAALSRTLGDLFDFELQPKIVLLDVSSNASRFGVALRPARHDDRVRLVAQPLKLWQIEGLDLSIDGRYTVLLTLPAVQWEPVRSVPGPEPFAEEVRFANSGVPTTIDVPSVRLVAINPLAAYKTIVDNFAQPTPNPSRARFTLPFGMLAQARLVPPSTAGRGARVGEVRPTDGHLSGAHQLRLDAADPTLGAGETPAFPGFTAQLPIAIPTSGDPPVSILGNSVTMIFNGYLGPGQPTALVPVTRIDLSGHGESLFSTWANPEDPETGVAKVEFQVLNGRAAHEVVQVKSILLPYFIPVVRTITLERQGNAVFTRQDSGWIAVRDGVYRASPLSGVVTHPGVVLRATRVTNIRETGTIVAAGGMEFIGAYFDCDLIVDLAAAPVPARRQLGYVKLTKTDLNPATYAALIQAVGPMGGPVDAGIGIGGGRHHMRLHRVGVGVAGPEFAMAAWGSLAFPGGGDWSVLEAASAIAEPAPVAADRGLPLIRFGAAGVATTAPYRFADPEDLFNEATPAREYGLLHSMGTHRVFYRRPRIEAAAPNRIVSSERPVIADPMTLATATGPFPRQSDAIPFPSAAYALEVRADGTWRLDAPATFPAGVPRRTVKTAGTVRSDLDYAAATVTYSLDTANPVPWRFRLQNAVKIMAHTSMGDLISMVADIDAEAGRPTSFGDPKLRLGGPFEIVEDLLTILKDLGVPARPDVRMTNKWELLVALTIPFVDAAGDDLQVIPGEPFPTIVFADTGIKIEMTIAPKNDEAVLEIGGAPMFAVKQFPGLYVVAIIKFKLKMSTESGTTYGILIGLGIAYKFKAGPFELKGLYAVTFFAVFGDTVLGYGIGFVIKVSAEIPPIVSIELSLEGKFARLVAQKSLPDETVFQIAKLVFAIEVSIFLVFSISMEIEAKQVEVIRGPLLADAVPDVL